MRQNLHKKLLMCCLICCYSFFVKGQITGKVFQDNNADSRQNPMEKGLIDIMVKAYDAKGKVVQETITDSSGNYLLTVPTGKKVRVEFTGFADGMYSSSSNFLNGNLTQFVTSPKSANNVGVFNPSLYDNGGAAAVSVSYTIGNSKDVIGDSATAVSYYSAVNPTKRYSIATMGQVGSIWGLAYDKTREKLYMSAFAKRHVGYGKLSTGGIYVYDFATGSIKPFLQASADLQIYAGADTHTGLGGYFNNGNRFNNIDSVFFDQVGKSSYGGLDVSEDGNYLFFMNLNTRQLMRIAIPRNNTPLKSSDVNSYTFPNDAIMGEIRPFAVKVYSGKVYVGVIHDAFKSQKVSDLKAVVYEINLSTGGTLKEIFSMSLDYPKGYPEVGYTSRRGWYPWTNDYKKGVVPESNGLWAIYPQPILSDIEFDVDGSMVLGFMDRYGHQGATNAQTNNPSEYSLLESGGDIIRVALVKGKYVLENNGKAGGVTTKGKDNNQGPGGGEYYFEDHFAVEKGRTVSEETASGGLAILPSTGELLATTREPHQYDWATQLHGVRYYNNQTGMYTRSVLTPSLGFQKSYGEGDVELVMDAPTTEIGNRAWFDCNENGIQDPDESPMKEALVELYQNGKQISITSTSASGEYTFGENNVPNGLEIGTDYELRIALSQTKYQSLQVTKTNVGTSREIDNDASVVGTNAVIKVKLEGAGMNTYALDFGFKCLEKPQANFTLACSGSAESKDAKITINKGFNPNDRFDVSKGITYENDMDYLNAKAIPDNGSLLTEKINLYKSSEYTVRLFNQNCYSDFVIKTTDAKDCYQQILAIETNEEELEAFVIYPNPATSTIKVDYRGKSTGDITVELVDIQGRVLQDNQVRKIADIYSTTFDINDMVSGTYIITVRGSLETVSKKFIKN